MAELRFRVLATSEEALGEKQARALHTHFSLRKNGGGCCEVTRLSPTEFRIEYMKREVQERVLEKREHEIKSEGQIFRVLIRKEEEPPPQATEPVQDAGLELSSNSAWSKIPLGSPSGAEKVEGYLFPLDPALHRHLSEEEAASELHQRLRNRSCHHTLLEEDGTGQILIFRAHNTTTPVQEWQSQVKCVLEEVTEEYFSKRRTMPGEEHVPASSPIATFKNTLLQAMLCPPPRSSDWSSVTTSDCKLDSPMKYQIIKEPFEKMIMSQFPNLSFSLTQEGLCSELHLEGTPEEVRRSREILKDSLGKVREYMFDLPNIIKQFLCSWPPLELSEMLFSQLQDRVTLEVTDKVVLFGELFPLLEEARKLLLDAIVEESVDIAESDRPATLTPAWKDLLTSKRVQMDKKLKVRCQGTPSHGCVRVTLVGFRDEVGQAKQTVLHHLSKEALVYEEVELKSVEIAQNFLDLLEILNVEKLEADAKAQLSPTPVIVLSGTKEAVAQSKSVIWRVLRTLVHEILTLPRAGSYEYFSGEGAKQLLTIGEQNKCLIRWITSLSDAEASAGTQENTQAGTVVTDTWCTFQLPGGFAVSVCQGDITKQHVDAIVNAANEDLKHGGGLSAVICKAGGPEIQKASKDWVQSHGKVLPGQAAMTSAGKLPCKKVIHAVGPRGRGAGNQSWELQEGARYLKSAITRSLLLAEGEKFNSIAIPCLSSGIFEVPIALCAEWIVNAVKSFTETYARANHSLWQVLLIDVRREVVSELQTACIKVWGGLVSALHRGDPAGGAAGGQATTASALKVTFQSGSLEHQKADVLLVPVLGKTFDLSSMRVGKSLLMKAGDSFNALYTSLKKGRQVGAGDVLEVDVGSGSYHLLCRTVLILGCSEWNGENGASAQALRSGFASCFRKCQALGASTVVVPIIGPGLALGFPVQSAARIFFQEVKRFGASQAWAGEIQLFIHPETPHLLQAYQEVQEEVESGGVHAASTRNGGALYHSLHESADRIQMHVGRFIVCVILGDLLKETTDAIVNPTNFKEPLPGCVSHAIFREAGPSITEEVKKANVSTHDILITQSGALPCHWIMHISIHNTVQDFKPQCIKQAVKKVLKKCQDLNLTSVAFPALVTGEGRMDLQISAAAMMDAIASVAHKDVQSSLTEVHLVIFRQIVFSAFKMELQNRLGQPADGGKNVLGGLIKLFKQYPNSPASTRPEIFESSQAFQPAMFDIMGGSKMDVDVAKREIEWVLEKNWLDKCFQRPQIADLQNQDVQRILAWGKDAGVHITIEKGLLNRVRLQGCERNVLRVQIEIQNLLDNLLQSRCEDIQQESLNLLVEWMYRLVETYIAFDATTNCRLEKHYDQSAGTGAGVTVCLDGTEATVDFAKMTATLRGTGKVARLKRRDLRSGRDLPLNWDDMSDQPLLLLKLDPNWQEYKGIQNNFLRTTTGLQIVKIQRIQNPHLQLAYEVKKQSISMKNGPYSVNEKRLFHGTAYQNSASINLHGFNRRYDANAKAYGNGVYFAVEACYSSHPRYSQADSLTGLRCMYQAKVVAGRYTEGKTGMNMPPARHGCGPNDLYDSVVDKINNPNMFVVFHDDQAYPEYLITFK